MRANQCVPRLRAISVIVVMIALAFTSSLAVHDTPAAAATWASPVTVDAGTFVGATLYRGVNFDYILSWIYPDGSVYLYKSSDDGATWPQMTNVFGGPASRARARMCGYEAGSSDHILVAGRPNIVAKSIDNGTTFARLTNLPLPSGADHWDTPEIGTNASWTEGTPDSDIYFAGSAYYPLNNTFVLGIVKSHDNGSSWGTPICIGPSDTDSYYPCIVSNSNRLFVFFSVLEPSESYPVMMRYSDDWGKTWSVAKQIIPANTYEGTSIHGLQYLDEHRALMTVYTMHVGSSNATGRYGYFDFDTMEYTEYGAYDNVADYGFCGKMVDRNNFTVAFIVPAGVGGPEIQLMYTYSHDTGLIGKGVPILLNVPGNLAMVGEPYEYNASAAPALSGSNTWTLNTNASWLSVAWNNGTRCLVTGTPTQAGDYWANLTVSNVDGSDFVNWTIEVPSLEHFSLQLVQGWNFVAVPLMGSDYSASTLGLQYRDVITGWNATTQTYDRTYLVGISPPAMDFDIIPGVCYWIYANSAETLDLSGYVPTGMITVNITVPLAGGWVAFAFLGLETHYAHELPGMYTGTIPVVVDFSESTQMYVTYIVGIPMTDFAILPGQAIWIYCTTSGTLTYTP